MILGHSISAAICSDHREISREHPLLPHLLEILLPRTVSAARYLEISHLPNVNGLARQSTEWRSYFYLRPEEDKEWLHCIIYQYASVLTSM